MKKFRKIWSIAGSNKTVAISEIYTPDEIAVKYDVPVKVVLQTIKDLGYGKIKSKSKLPEAVKSIVESRYLP